MMPLPPPPGAGLPYQCTIERSSSWVQLPFTATPTYASWGRPVNSTSAEASDSLPPPPQVAVAAGVVDAAAEEGPLDGAPASQLFTALTSFAPRAATACFTFACWP